MTRIKQERGMAMVVALLVTFVVMVLSTIVVQQAIHNTTQSGHNRDRVLAVNAAEAGVDWFYNYIQTTTLADIAVNPYTSANPMSQAMATAPTTAEFEAYAVYYDEDGEVMDPSTFSDINPPASVFVRSVGSVGGQQSRAIETLVKLRPVYGGFGAAIVTMNGLSLQNNLTLNGFTTSDADVYINSGDLVIRNQPNIFGSVYVVDGSASLDGNSNIRQNLWAYEDVSIDNPSMVTYDVMSSTGAISGNGGEVGADATAYTAINGVDVGGTSTVGVLQGHPPSYSMPKICWDTIPGVCEGTSSAWAAEGYYNPGTFGSCDAAKAYILSNPTPPVGYTGIVVRITPTCALSFSDKVTLNGDLAIFTDGSISFANNNTWTGAGSEKTLLLIDNYRSGLVCSTGAYDISTSNKTDFVNANVLFYTPCTITLENRNVDFGGQVIGGTVNIKNQFTLNFVPVKVPGAGEITGFDEDIAYIREVK
ncbi:MAG: pilus assembly PilX N-terminal domain-containing protein [Actinomycetota bacterium]